MFSTNWRRFYARESWKPSLAVTYLIVPAGFFPIQGGADKLLKPFLGQIMLFAGTPSSTKTRLL